MVKFQAGSCRTSPRQICRRFLPRRSPAEETCGPKRILILADTIRSESAQSSDEDLLASVSRTHPAADIHLTATASNGFEAAETGASHLLRMHKNPEPPQSLQHRT